METMIHIGYDLGPEIRITEYTKKDCVASIPVETRLCQHIFSGIMSEDSRTWRGWCWWQDFPIDDEIWRELTIWMRNT